jgi:hypothetical protein
MSVFSLTLQRSPAQDWLFLLLPVGSNGRQWPSVANVTPAFVSLQTHILIHTHTHTHIHTHTFTRTHLDLTHGNENSLLNFAEYTTIHTHTHTPLSQT